MTLLAARSDAIRRYKATHKGTEDAEVNARLVAYCSDQVLLLVNHVHPW